MGVMVAGIVLLVGCGLGASEPQSLTEVAETCTQLRPYATVAEASESAELIVTARPTDSYFVDRCHRAFVLEVDQVLKGQVTEPVLVIVQVDPSLTQSWADTGYPTTPTFLLERDPEVPEAFRPVSDVSGIVAQ